MASVQDKMEALAYWVGGSILCVVMAFFGTPLWSLIHGINSGFGITGEMGMSNLHAVQPIPLIYYGFLGAFEIALIIRTAFVVWSATTYEQGY
jgi:hypothetical protein